jgi:hypothetical protein
MLTTVLTGALFLVAWMQLRDLARTSRTGLLHRFKKDFFTSENRSITLVLDLGILRFNQIGFFDIEKGGWPGSSKIRRNHVAVDGRLPRVA